MHGSDQSYRRNNGGGTLCHAGSALRGEASPAHHISGAGSIQRRENRSNGSLSLDMLPEDVADSSWLADTYDYTEEISTKLLERSLRESLTPTQYGIYQACILNGISYKAYADRMDVSYQSVQNAIRLIQKKAKNIFG